MCHIMAGQTLSQAAQTSKTLLSFHRRFLLRNALGVRWRASIVDHAAAKGIIVDGSSISHVVTGSRRSKRLEQFIAEILGMAPEEIWPARGAQRERGKPAPIASAQRGRPGDPRMSRGSELEDS